MTIPVLKSSRSKLPEYIDKLILVEYDGETKIEITPNQNSELRKINWAGLSIVKKELMIDEWCHEYTNAFQRNGYDFWIVNVKVITKSLFKS